MFLELALRAWSLAGLLLGCSEGWLRGKVPTWILEWDMSADNTHESAEAEISPNLGGVLPTSIRLYPVFTVEEGLWIAATSRGLSPMEERCQRV